MKVESTAPKTSSNTVRLIKNKNYRHSWGAGLSSSMSRLMWTFVCSYLIFELTESAFLTSLVAVVSQAPLIVLGIFSGTLCRDPVEIWTGRIEREEARRW